MQHSHALKSWQWHDSDELNRTKEQRGESLTIKESRRNSPWLRRQFMHVGKWVNADTTTPHDRSRGFPDEATSALDAHELKMKRHCTLPFTLQFLIDLSEVAHDRGAALHWNAIEHWKTRRSLCRSQTSRKNRDTVSMIPQKRYSRIMLH